MLFSKPATCLTDVSYSPTLIRKEHTSNQFSFNLCRYLPCIISLSKIGAWKKWTHWGLNPGPSACEADVIPLHHVPSDQSQNQIHRKQKQEVPAQFGWELGDLSDSSFWILPDWSIVKWYIITSGVAQWLACWAHNPKVRGSKPRSAILIPIGSMQIDQNHHEQDPHENGCHTSFPHNPSSIGCSESPGSSGLNLLLEIVANDRQIASLIGMSCKCFLSSVG